MAEQLARLKSLKGTHRVYKYYGDNPKRRYKKFLTDAKVMRDPDELADTEGESHRDHEHLIFSNCVANIGKGILLLEITRGKRRNRARVKQVIQDDATPREDWQRIKAGSAVFDKNPDHNHWHFADFLEYTLRRVSTGRLVKRGLKQSFCLEDVAKLDKRVGRRGFPECPDIGAKTGKMGISPGWGDVYWSGVQEQYIEVKGLQRGWYWLECVIDPKNRLTVQSRSQHKTRARIELK